MSDRLREVALPISDFLLFILFVDSHSDVIVQMSERDLAALARVMATDLRLRMDLLWTRFDGMRSNWSAPDEVEIVHELVDLTREGKICTC